MWTSVRFSVYSWKRVKQILKQRAPSFALLLQGKSPVSSGGHPKALWTVTEKAKRPCSPESWSLYKLRVCRFAGCMSYLSFIRHFEKWSLLDMFLKAKSESFLSCFHQQENKNKEKASDGGGGSGGGGWGQQERGKGWREGEKGLHLSSPKFLCPIHSFLYNQKCCGVIHTFPSFTGTLRWTLLSLCYREGQL